MKPYFSINPHTVHLWRIILDPLAHFEQKMWSILSNDEKTRAARFHFSLHKQRFILAHGVARKILGLYTGILASEIQLIQGPHGKPYLKEPYRQYQFNLSHSHEMAVLAVCLQDEIGVDVEKFEPSFKEGVAKRYFSKEEYGQLMALPEEARAKSFYRIWSRKEALLKSLGAGLHAAMQNYFVGFEPSILSNQIEYEEKQYCVHIESVHLAPNFESAFVVQGTVDRVEYWEWDLDHDSVYSPNQY